jgi:uncharacterized protein YtpQ (UPF0354 family)
LSIGSEKKMSLPAYEDYYPVAEVNKINEVEQMFRTLESKLNQYKNMFEKQEEKAKLDAQRKKDLIDQELQLILARINQERENAMRQYMQKVLAVPTDTNLTKPSVILPWFSH